MWLDNLKNQISEIKQSSYYEGDFGDCVSDSELLFDKVKNKDLGPLNDYRDFMQHIGFGELDASFYIEDGPSPYEVVYKREIPGLEGMYIFASDQSEYVYAFDSNNDFQVVDISASGELEKHYGSFKEFISKKINDIKDMADWREDNL